MNRIISSSFLILMLFFSLKAQATSSLESRTQTFEKVWNTVNEKHFDPTFGGVDWKKVGEIYQPKIIAAKTDAEFYSLLQDMLSELHQSHFSIIPPNAEITPTISGEGEIGIDLQIIEKAVIIIRVNPNSPAERSGLKPGFIIQSINDKTIAEILTPLEEKLGRRKNTLAQKEIQRNRILLTAISGKIGSSVKIEALNKKNKLQVFQIERVAFTGEMSPALAGLPPQRIVFEQKRIVKNIGYIRFNMWLLPQMVKLREAIRNFQDAKGLIIDLRGNPGGIGAMTQGLAGLFVTEETSLGTSKNRFQETQLSVYPQDNPFSGRLLILTDSGTGSASEVFTAGMQGIKRAKVVGTTSAGAVLPAIIEKLPTGAKFLYATSDYRSPGNILVEGRGVKPDVEVKLTRKTLLQGRDLQIETAIKEILKNK